MDYIQDLNPHISNPKPNPNKVSQFSPHTGINPCVIHNIKGSALANDTTALKNTAHNADTTLVFLTYNLGANPNLSTKQQMAYQSTLNGETRTDITVYGSLYRWGRSDAAHSFRCDYAADLAANHSDLFTQDLYTSATLSAAGKFVWGTSGSNVYNNSYNWYFPHDSASTLWGNGKTVENGGNASPSAGTTNPCPSGFRVPTQHEWALLGEEGYSSTSTSSDEFSTSGGASGTSEGNSNYTDLTGYALYTSDTCSGIADKARLTDPDDMFLPATGYRNYIDGRVYGTGNYGYYWSSIVNGYYGRYMYFYRVMCTRIATVITQTALVSGLSELMDDTRMWRKNVFYLWTTAEMIRHASPTEVKLQKMGKF